MEERCVRYMMYVWLCVWSGYMLMQCMLIVSYRIRLSSIFMTTHSAASVFDYRKWPISLSHVHNARALLDDTMLWISNSGESEELPRLLDHVWCTKHFFVWISYKSHDRMQCVGCSCSIHTNCWRIRSSECTAERKTTITMRILSYYMNKCRNMRTELLTGGILPPYSA